MNSVPNKHLWQCSTRQEQLAWIEEALRKGATVSDSGLWLGGVDRPEQAIASLRQSGLQIETTRKAVVDAAGERHRDLAWKLA